MALLFIKLSHFFYYFLFRFGLSYPVKALNPRIMSIPFPKLTLKESNEVQNLVLTIQIPTLEKLSKKLI